MTSLFFLWGFMTVFNDIFIHFALQATWDDKPRAHLIGH